ncbi:MAG: hypothetical protein ACI82G_003176 [Bradymonadia bacterium]
MALTIRRLTLSSFLAVSVLATGSTGCFFVRSTPPSAEEIASRRVARASGRAANQAARIDELQTRLRSNPAACDCPEWELWLSGRWTRVAVVFSDDGTADSLQGRAFRDPQPGTVRSTGDVEPAGDGWPYPVFEWLDIPSD